MKILYVVIALLVLLLSSMPIVFLVQARLGNPRVAQELRDQPQGERARKVMLIRLPSGREIPVNYLREDGRLYAGADGRWWKELEGGHFPVEVYVQGEQLGARARAVRDDPAYEKDIFSRLRPTAVPGFGTLVEILLDPRDPGGPKR